jgi:hypothetical protein
MKAVGLKEIEQIFEVIEPMGISREAVVIPLRTANPGTVKQLPNGKLEIVVDGEQNFDEWVAGLGAKITELMNRESD